MSILLTSVLLLLLLYFEVGFTALDWVFQSLMLILAQELRGSLLPTC